jgi:cell wall-associated NlpC family hydrolase
MALLLKSSRPLLCVLAISLALCADTQAATRPDGGHGGTNAGLIGYTALLAATATNSSGALGAGLNLLDTWLRANAANRAAEVREAEAGAAPPASSPSGPPNGGGIPAASAGSNGTTTPPPPSSLAAPIVAHSLSATGSREGGPTTTLINGIALAPPSAPEPIKGAIDAANSISTTPYVWGGGHGSWFARGYDCSGAVSFALFGGGFLSAPLASGQLESWGAPGPGRWLTVYANAGHAYAVIAGLRWDTVGDARGSGPRWHPNKNAESGGFVARHYPGY